MLTKLDIINEAIGAVGLAPVSSIDSRHPSFLKAKATFDRVNSKLQAKGWWFNRSYRTLQPGSDNTIVVPQFASIVDVIDDPNWIVRGSRLYNRITGSREVPGPLRCRIIEVLPVEELPQIARTYVSAFTKFTHYLDEDGTEPKLTAYREEASIALAEFKAEHLRHERVNGFEANSYLKKKFPYTRVAKVR